MTRFLHLYQGKHCTSVRFQSGLSSKPGAKDRGSSIPNWTPILAIAMAALFFSLGTSTTPLFADDDPPPPLLPVPIAVLETDTFDWGSLIQGQKIQHSFMIENKGRSALKILKVTANCGCTTTRYDEEIAPGEIGAIDLEIDTSEFAGGRPRRSAVVQTNDPMNSEIRLWMSGNVEPILRMDTSVIRISGLLNEDKSLAIQLLKAVESAVEIVEVKSVNGNFVVDDLEPADEATWNLLLSAGTSETSQSLRDEMKIKVRVDGGEPFEYPVPVVVQHQDLYRFNPGGNVVFYRRHTAPLDGPVKREVSQELHVRSSRADVNIDNFRAMIKDAPEGLFKLEVFEEIPGQHYRLKIQVLKTHPTPQAQGTLVMDLGNGEVREKSIIAQFRLRPVPKQDSSPR
ncbi:MAG: hypothetical protein CBC13_04555 [Planctomycetia bacterium TMED53]|nr:MAG: hypothetical protein CBC13_04555 [Planctomycetia bacterium TMED53]